MEEKAWNAYPYTKTRYTCPFVEKFSIEIETKYFDDDGSQENVFNLDESELSTRVVGMLVVAFLAFRSVTKMFFPFFSVLTLLPFSLFLLTG